MIRGSRSQRASVSAISSSRRFVAAALAAWLVAAAAKPPPIDVHVYAEDAARQLATLAPAGSRFRIEPPSDYFGMSVAAQMRSRGFVLTVEDNAEPLRFSLTDGRDRGRLATTVNLVAGATVLTRTYEAATGRPLGNWRNASPVLAAPAVSERDQLYTLGRGVEATNQARALAYYRQAADLGQMDASVRLGLLLIAQGKAAEGMPFVVRASAAGNARANYVLGVAMVNGDGVAKDPARGKALLRLARDRGFAAAEQALAGLP